MARVKGEPRTQRCFIVRIAREISQRLSVECYTSLRVTIVTRRDCGSQSGFIINKLGIFKSLPDAIIFRRILPRLIENIHLLQKNILIIDWNTFLSDKLWIIIFLIIISVFIRFISKIKIIIRLSIIKNNLFHTLIKIFSSIFLTLLF